MSGYLIKPRHFRKPMKEKLFLALLLIFFGIVCRVLFVNFLRLPNFEIITAIALVSGALVSGVFTFIIPFCVIAISDTLIGNTSIVVFTWSAFAIVGVFGWLLRKQKKYLALKLTLAGVVSVLFFFLYTNFGWWILSSMYPKTLNGLLNCYVAGLPFLRNQLFSALLFVPLLSFLCRFVFFFSLLLS